MMTTPSDDVCELVRLMSLTTVSVRAVLAKAMGEMDGARQANAPPNATDHDSVTASSFCVYAFVGLLCAQAPRFQKHLLAEDAL
jgi:hypothetical protein